MVLRSRTSSIWNSSWWLSSSCSACSPSHKWSCLLHTMLRKNSVCFSWTSSRSEPWAKLTLSVARQGITAPNLPSSCSHAARITTLGRSSAQGCLSLTPILALKRSPTITSKTPVMKMTLIIIVGMSSTSISLLWMNILSTIAKMRTSAAPPSPTAISGSILIQIGHLVTRFSSLKYPALRWKSTCRLRCTGAYSTLQSVCSCVSMCVSPWHTSRIVTQCRRSYLT